ncbi:Structural maintenance of chromosomes protein 6 [Cercospora zeina]
MAGRKRSRDPDDIDGDTEVEIENATSSFRQNDANHKRTKVAMAQGMGSSVASEEIDDYEEALMADSDDAGDGESDIDYTLRQDSSDNEQEEDEVDEIKATQFVEKKLREHKENVPAESGVIEMVYMRNFMCHSNLTIELGPLINFIIGHNGSGKSAVLTALQISLGNKASGTNRAKSLKDMIKAGTDSGMVGVKIKNQGENAYKPELYGETLTVERHFTKGGSTTFKLKSTEGRIITTKKGDLDDVLDHFALQMDNPINVLTQDLARAFLAGSTPAEKYRFFIKGTQLETLDGDYNILEEHLDGTEAQLLTREEMIAELRQKEVEAAGRVKRAERARALEDRWHNLARQHAWAQVGDAEATLQHYEDNVTKARQQVQDHEQIAEDAGVRFDSQDNAVEAAERGVEAVQENLRPLKDAHAAATEKFTANKAELMKLVAQERTIKENIKTHKKEIQRLEAQVVEERQRLNEAHGDAHEQRLVKLDELKAKAEQAKEALNAHKVKLPDLTQAVKATQERLQHAEAPVKAAEQDEAKARTALDRVAREQGRKWAPYHPKMEELCRAIDRETRFRTKPVGPMGLHVQLIKPQWGSLIEKTFGNSLDSFVVSSKPDQELLQSLSRRVGCPANSIIIARGAFDTAGHEPEDDSDTILRVLRIDHPLVKQALVINHSCEQTVLIEEIDAGKSYMFDSGHRKNVRAVLTMARRAGDGQRWEWSRTGEQRVSGMAGWNGRTRMVTDRQQETELRQRALQTAQRALEDAKQDRKAVQLSLNQAKQAVEKHRRETNILNIRHQEADDEVEKVQNEIDANIPQDGRLQELENQLKEVNAELEGAKAAMEDAIGAKADLNDRARELKTAVDQAQQALDKEHGLIARAEERLSKCKDGRTEALFAKNAALADVNRYKEHLERTQQKVLDQQAVVDEWTSEARKTSERVGIEDGQTIESLGQQLSRLQEDIKKAQRQQGGSREELVEAHLKAHNALSEAKNETKMMKQTADTLKSTLTERRRRWGLFRKYISMRTRIQFNYLLSERNFRGRVLLDHSEKKLDIHVEPDMTKASDSGRQAKTLSGGEKSFSTICLLLSIWEAMGSPIRCLDEFDVYMDSVNRAQSMGLMIQTARRSVGRQFILITPQSMSNVDLGDDVHVHKMADPERRREPGQSSLNFGRT